MASKLLAEAAFAVKICASPNELLAEVEMGAGLVVMSEDLAALDAVLQGLPEWIKAQPPWSDLPIIVLTGRTDAPYRNRGAAIFHERFGNVSFLERPFHPTTLVSLARTAVRSRHRQYEARASIARYELLARELQHRTKNLLSVILAIASASLRVDGASSEDFIARLHSLAKAQDRIFEDGGGGALLEHVVRSVLESFGARISVEGPRVFLKANVAQGFALIVHELATNAVKHGALTVPTGNISVRWDLNAGVEEPTITFTWREQGGPAANPPAHKGFGTLLLEKAVASTNGPPKFSFGPSGFSYEITAFCR